MPISDYPALMDPQTIGILTAASNGLSASGPSLMPRSIGQIAGGALGAGLGAYQSAWDLQRKTDQTQALIDLEKMKAIQTDLATKVQLEDVNMRRGFLGLPPIQSGITGAMPIGATPTSGVGGMPAIPQGAIPGAPTAAPQGMGASPTASAPGMVPTATSGGLNLAALPPDLRQAAIADIAMNKGQGLAGIIAKAGEPVIGREGGLYNRGPNGLTIDPGFLAGEEQLRRIRAGVANENEVVSVPLADGRTQQMTKAQQLSLTNASGQIQANIPGILPSQLAAVQRAMLEDPTKSVSVDLNLNGQRVKKELPPLSGMPGFTAGQSTASKAAAEASGNEAGKVQEKIDTEAASALQSRKILGEMRTLSQDFTQGKVAPFKRALGEWAQALNLPGNWADEIKSAESQQALQKLTAQMATAAMKQFTNRGTQMEFKTFLENNPNAALTPGGFQKVLEFMDKTAESSLAKQQAYVEWRKTNPLERSQDFLTEWNQKQNEALGGNSSPAMDAKPPAQQNKGKRIRDTATGQMFESDGMAWKPVK